MVRDCVFGDHEKNMMNLKPLEQDFLLWMLDVGKHPPLKENPQLHFLYICKVLVNRSKTVAHCHTSVTTVSMLLFISI